MSQHLPIATGFGGAAIVGSRGRYVGVLITTWACTTLLACSVALAQSKRQRIPHAQDKPPGPWLSPEDAVKKMTVPEGFTVEIVAAEPDIINPIAMTFDERGRIWVAESVEYPRHSPGKGRDRVKVLEDTDGDGRVDKTTVFADGLNIPSGLAVGHGGVWIANAPDLLFMQDTDGDGKADRREVVVTGFGRRDTHELPNSLTWGPDGWLYGLNGVFNPCHIKYRGKEYRFTCALFRIHPRTRDFEIFCEGTSNPWGVTWDTEGNAFISACVIDHLWHLTETGYYHRQGGPYPAFTWKLGSIVKHKHQKAAYCGIHYFDSDAYPEKYRRRLYMGNIHGGCINVDELTRDGSTYFAKPNPDFLTANDAWFMPVVQKTGPDGCLYILDWYDKYHCYQDARRDPKGIDRRSGRLYRVRYRDTPRKTGFDLAKESDERLVEHLKSPNIYFRDIAQRLLSERNTPKAKELLQKMILADEQPRVARMHALWALVSADTLEPEFHAKLLAHKDASFRAWGVRAAGNQRTVADKIRERVLAMSEDDAADVRLQVAIAAKKISGVDPIPVLMAVLDTAGDDQLIPQIVWQNLHPLLGGDLKPLFAELKSRDLAKNRNLQQLMPRIAERILARPKVDTDAVAQLFVLLAGPRRGDFSAASKCLATLAKKVQTKEISGDAIAGLKQILQPTLDAILDGKPSSPLYWNGALLAASWRDAKGIDVVRSVFRDGNETHSRRVLGLAAQVAAGDKRVLDDVAEVLQQPKSTAKFQGQVLGELGQLTDPRLAQVVLAQYNKLPPDIRPRAIELLTQRDIWSRQLVDAVSSESLPASSLNVNQIRKLLSSRDQKIVEGVRKIWGSVRTERDPKREQVIARMRKFIRKTPGDATAGVKVFHKVCGQCHKIHGKGFDVGPDLTLNGRSSFEQLLSNVFDPSLVIGPSYQARTVATTDGRVIIGLLAESNDRRVVLKTQGGKLETIPRDRVDEIVVSKLSMMPENVESQLKPREIADLFAFLTLDLPPDDPKAKRLPGVYERK